MEQLGSDRAFCECVHSYILNYLLTYILTYIHTYILTYIYTCTDIYAYLYTAVLQIRTAVLKDQKHTIIEH